MIEYEMYKGDEFLYIGTVAELAKKHGVKKNTIYHYASDAYQRKVAKRKKAENYIVMVKLDD